MVLLNIVSLTFPHFSHFMLTTMVMCHNVMLEKTFVLHNFYVPAHTYFMCRESATSCGFYRRRRGDVFLLKTVEECAKFHEACQQTGLFCYGIVHDNVKP